MNYSVKDFLKQHRKVLKILCLLLSSEEKALILHISNFNLKLIWSLPYIHFLVTFNFVHIFKILIISTE